jgi:hypothetical protein
MKKLQMISDSENDKCKVEGTGWKKFNRKEKTHKYKILTEAEK